MLLYEISNANMPMKTETISKAVITYKCRITIKKKAEKTEQDNSVLNATDVSLYYLGDTYKSYIQYLHRQTV